VVRVTLRCEWGGAVEIQGGTDSDNVDDGFFEWYECLQCGRTAGFEADPVDRVAMKLGVK
jgi:hypothetical protein